MNCVLDSRYRNLMKSEIARARRYFRQAEKGVHLLSEDSRLPVQASLDTYSQILNVLESNGYDNFNRRAYISKSRKLCTVPISYLRTKQTPEWKPVLNALEFLLNFKSRSARNWIRLFLIENDMKSVSLGFHLPPDPVKILALVDFGKKT